MTINWIRLIVGGLIASVILFVTDGFFTNEWWPPIGPRFITGWV
jgi:hypothetical protein